MWSLIECPFSMLGINASNWQWYRRWRGGHWERCWVEPCWGYVWMRLDHEEAARSSIRTHSTIEKLVECESWA